MIELLCFITVPVPFIGINTIWIKLRRLLLYIKVAAATRVNPHTGYVLPVAPAQNRLRRIANQGQARLLNSLLQFALLGLKCNP